MDKKVLSSGNACIYPIFVSSSRFVIVTLLCIKST